MKKPIRKAAEIRRDIRRLMREWKKLQRELHSHPRYSYNNDFYLTNEGVHGFWYRQGQIDARNAIDIENKR